MGNTIGQANAVSDKLLDLRGCTYDGKDLHGRTLSGALMVDASFQKADMTEVVMSKAYAVKARFDGANFRNAVLDRVIFNGSSMKGVSFVNAGALSLACAAAWQHRGGNTPPARRSHHRLRV